MEGMLIMMLCSYAISNSNSGVMCNRDPNIFIAFYFEETDEKGEEESA